MRVDPGPAGALPGAAPELLRPGRGTYALVGQTDVVTLTPDDDNETACSIPVLAGDRIGLYLVTDYAGTSYTTGTTADGFRVAPGATTTVGATSSYPDAAVRRRAVNVEATLTS